MLRHWYSNLSLRAKAIGISVAITTIALTGVAATGIVQISRQIAAEQHRSADSMALGFARASELAIAVSDTKELSRLANSFLRDDNVLFIAAYGDRPAPLATAIRDREAWENYQRHAVDPSRCAVGERAVEHSTQNDEFSGEANSDFGAVLVDPPKPVSHAEANLGRVVVGLSTAQSLLAQREQARLTIVTTFCAAGIGALILSLTLGAWMRRLQRLADASQSISNGDFTTSITDRASDEIGKLARSFDTMRQALSDRDKQLRGFTETLQDQVKQRTQELEKALTVAEEASRAKSLFLANMSHELRTPLNGVIGMVDLLLAAEPNPRQRRYCEIAKSSARSLLELINDILDFSKIEAGKLELDKTDFDLHQIMESVMQMLGERAEARKLELACDVNAKVPQIVSGDPTRLRQVIINLTTNAIKFTEKGEVIVGAELESQTETHVLIRFSVRDTGIGIPKERMERLFKSFSQVDASTTRKFGGTGLGLAISQRIAEMMGGKIGVESVEGKGSTFWFTATFEKRAHRVMPTRELRADPRGLRVLAVDDNLTNREILHAQLASWSLQADVADGAVQAMQMLRASAARGVPYRFAILDMQMPDVDGVQLARKIKDDPTITNTILISLGSLADPIKPRTMSNLGFAACLTKPALPSQLYNAIIDSLAASLNQGEAVLEAKPVAADSAQLDGITVLLAEDNEVNRLVASELLEQAGATTTIVVNGREARDAALSGKYDVILMDCQMPEMDGYEATKSIRDAEALDPAKPHRMIIALTANAIKGDREICLAAGMDGYVTKPIDPDELFQTIRSFVWKRPRGKSNVRAPGSTANVPSSNRLESAAHSRTPGEVPPVDLATLQKRCMGNKKIAAKALNKFDSGIERDFHALAQSIQRGEVTVATSAVHKIKGAAGNVSADGLCRIATELEQLIRNDALGQTQNCLEQFGAEVERFRKYLSTAIGELTPPEQPKS